MLNLKFNYAKIILTAKADYFMVGLYMIIDKLSNISNHVKNPELCEAIKTFLQNAQEKEVGTHTILGKTVAKVQEYQTKPLEQVKTEAHVKFIDLQYMHTGCELVLSQNIEGQKPVTEYNDVKDVIFYSPEKYEKSQLLAGYFAIMLPEDLHQCVALNNPEQIKKVVVKIPIEEF